MRFVCDYCNDLTNIEADRMEIQGEKLMVYSRGRLVYVADLGQIMRRAGGMWRKRHGTTDKS